MKFKYIPLRIAGLNQIIKLTADVNLTNIRPHIYRRQTPAGSLKVQIFDQKGFLVSESNTVNISQIGVGGVINSDFAHGNLQFDIETPLKKDRTYRIGLLAFNGYTFTDTAHIGFVKANPDFTKVPKAFAVGNELDIELWGRDQVTREIDFFDGFESSSVPASGEQATILDNQAAPVDLVGLLFDLDFVHRARVAISFFRRDDTQDKIQAGVFELVVDPEAVAWKTTPEGVSHYDVAEVTLSVTAAGQVQYVSTNFGGANYNGYAVFDEITILKPGV